MDPFASFPFDILDQYIYCRNKKSISTVWLLMNGNVHIVGKYSKVRSIWINIWN